MKPTWQISRRAVLRGAGVGVALPFLEQMMPRTARAQAKPPQRLVVLFKPNGTNMREWTPASVGTGFALSPTLAALAPYKDQVVVVSGLHNKVALPNANLHLAGIAAFLTGAYPSPSKIGVSMDQVIATAWKGKTRFASLQLGSAMSSGEFDKGTVCEGNLPCKTAFTMSMSDEKTFLPTETNPQAAFDRLFAAGVPTSMPGGAPDPTAERRREAKKSILDFVRERTMTLQGKLGPSDKRRLEGYLTSVRELEQRLAPMASPGGGGTGATCTGGTRPTNTMSAPYPDRIAAMLDVIALALQCDLTRVVTFMLAEAESEYNFPVPGVGSGDGHHGTSHHGGDAGQLGRYAAIDRWYVGHVATLAGKLKAMQESTGSLLDHTILLHGSEVSDGDSHSYDNLPIVMVGGGGGILPSGRHVRLAGERPLADLHLTLMKGMGIDRASLGNSTGPLNLAG